MGECGTCGQIHVAALVGHRPCIRHRSRSGAPCRGNAMLGLEVCGAHGGRARQVKAAGRRRAAEQKARTLVQTYGLKIETTATEALLEEVKWTAGHVQWLREKVAELEEQALVWGRTREKAGGDDWGRTDEAKPNAFLVLYQTERTHLVKVCSEAIKAGIEERRVRLAEQQGALVADVIKRILDDLGLTPTQQAQVAEVVPRHLRLLTA